MIINDSWVLKRGGSFSTSFSGFLSGIIGGFKLTDSIKAGLDIALAVPKAGGLGFVQPLLEKVYGIVGAEIEPEVRQRIQKKLEKAEATAQQKMDEAEAQQKQKIEAKIHEKEKKFESDIEKRLIQLEADQAKSKDTIGQQIAYQLFSTNVDSLVDALYSVAKERGITNEQILRIIKALPELEALMYIMNVRKFYRDHTAHSLRVATLGDYILDKEGLAGRLESLIMEKLNFTREEARTTWWFTGLLHDIGTPLAKLFTSLNWSLINEMTRCYSPLGMDFIPFQISVNHPDLENTRYLKILCQSYPKQWQKFIKTGLGVTQETGNSFRYSSQTNGPPEYKPISPNIDHGVIAAVTLLRTLGTPEYIEENHPQTRPLIEAARAIALHNCIEKLEPLSFEDYPLLFLLAVCDELQEWGRPIPVTSEAGYFTTSLQKVTLTDAIFHDTSLELWDLPFTNAEAKQLMRFDFKRLHRDKENKLKGLDCTQQFPETDLFLIDFDKSSSEVADKYEIKIQSR